MVSEQVDIFIWYLDLIKRICQGGFLLWGLWTAAPILTRNYAEFRRRLQPWGGLLTMFVFIKGYDWSIIALQWFAHQMVEVEAVQRTLGKTGVHRIWLEELLPQLLVTIVAFWFFMRFDFGKTQRDQARKNADAEAGPPPLVEKQGADSGSDSSAKNAKEEAD